MITLRVDVPAGVHEASRAVRVVSSPASGLVSACQRTFTGQLDRLRGVADGRLALLLDCGQVSRIDSQGIQALVRGFTSVEKQGGKLKLLNPSPKMREVLEVTHLLLIIESFDDEEAARRSFAE